MKKQKKAPVVKKQEPVYKSFLYLIPEEIPATELLGKLDFLPADSLEIWTEIDILEITTEADRTITFECITEDLYEEDLAILGEMSLKQVYIFEYAEEDRALLQKIMNLYLENYGGKIGSDTDDFSPFLSVDEL